MSLKKIFLIKEVRGQGSLKDQVHPELKKAIDNLVTQTYESMMFTNDGNGTDEREFIEAVETIANLAGAEIYWNNRDTLDKQNVDDTESDMSALHAQPPGYKSPGAGEQF